MKIEFVWLSILVLVAACAAPRATPVRPARSTAPVQVVPALNLPAVRGDATDDLVGDNGQRIPAPREEARVFVNGVERP